MAEVTVEIGEPYADMLEELKEDHGEEMVEGDLTSVIEDSIHKSY